MSWETMVRRTTMLFHREGDFGRHAVGDDAYSDAASAVVRGSGAGALSTFVRLLMEEMAANGGDEGFDVTLVGHSMGTIVVNRLLTEFPDFPADRVVYMAAACSLQDYRDSVLPLLRRRPAAEMFHLTLHPAAERSEMQWWLGPLAFFAPRGSLLGQIDSYFARPRSLLDRTAGRFDNLMESTHLIDTPGGEPDVASRVHYRRFAWSWTQDDEQPRTHGAFDNFRFWKEGFWTGCGADAFPGRWDSD